MPTSLPACVIDSNILIDLYHGGLVPAVFGLPYYLMTTEYLLDELPEGLGAQLQRLGLVFAVLSGDDNAELVRLRGQHSALSFYDLSVFVLAARTNAWLLTGERRMRSLAREAGLTVHGVLWLLDELIRHQVITPPVAAQALRQILRAGGRLPREECRKRLARWDTLSLS